MNQENAKGFGVGLLVGAAIGGVVALLFAPKTGKETRQIIQDKTNGIVDTLKEKTVGVVDIVKEAAYEANRKGQTAVHALKN